MILNWFFQLAFSAPTRNCSTTSLEINNFQPTFYLIESPNVSTMAYLWRTLQTSSRLLNTHDYSRKNGKNIFRIGYGTTIGILFKSTCASVLMYIIMVKKNHIQDGFLNYFSCYNKMLYRWRWKASITNSLFKQYHESLKFGFFDAISILEEVYDVYFAKPDARVTSCDIHKAMKGYYCTKKISIKSQWRCQWQRCKDK